MKVNLENFKSYSINAIVILFSVILSFYIDGRRELNEKNINKNKLINDLINTINEDINQIDYIKSQVSESVKNFNIILNDIDSKNQNISTAEILEKLVGDNVGISFFPQEGIFNQLIATGSFELIEKNELKSLLLEIYNHQNNRNYATSYQIDLFQIKFSESIYNNFRVNSEYNYKEGEIYGKPVVKSFSFNENYYYSNEFYGLLAEGKVNGNNYLRLIDNIRENYVQAKIYAEYEINN